MEFLINYKNVISIAFIIIIVTICFLIIGKRFYLLKIKEEEKFFFIEEKLQRNLTSLKENLNDLKKQRDSLDNDIDHLIIRQQVERENLNILLSNAETTLKNQENLSKQAYKNFFEVLEKDYDEKSKEYDILTENLLNAYSNQQEKILEDLAVQQKELDKIKSTKAAAIEASRREKEIEESISFYCLKISDADKADIARLENLKSSLNKPRVLSMLIWSTWFQKPLKTLATNLNAIGKTGIYKITNIKTKECYIGQAVDIGGSRWPEHCKCGLGIDTPPANKLYKAMSEYGLWNFSFEVLEECPREQLNEKERFYIDLYQSYDFGYNSNKGISK